MTCFCDNNNYIKFYLYHVSQYRQNNNYKVKLHYNDIYNHYVNKDNEDFYSVRYLLKSKESKELTIHDLIKTNALTVLEIIFLKKIKYHKKKIIRAMTLCRNKTEENRKILKMIIKDAILYKFPNYNIYKEKIYSQYDNKKIKSAQLVIKIQENYNDKFSNLKDKSISSLKFIKYYFKMVKETIMRELTPKDLGKNIEKKFSDFKKFSLIAIKNTTTRSFDYIDLEMGYDLQNVVNIGHNKK